MQTSKPQIVGEANLARCLLVETDKLRPHHHLPHNHHLKLREANQANLVVAANLKGPNQSLCHLVAVDKLKPKEANQEANQAKRHLESKYQLRLSRSQTLFCS